MRSKYDRPVMSTRGWRLAGIVGVLFVATAEPSGAVPTCVRDECRPQGRACARAFRDRLSTAIEACATKACRRAARQAAHAGIEACRASRRDCAACCRESGDACPVGVCGNGLVESGEACDAAATGTCAGGCRADCTCVPVVTPPVCGNAIHEVGEECDGVDSATCPGRCRIDCICGPPPACGNDVVEAGEECDGESIGSCEVACAPGCVCVPAVCGNAIIGGIEECDGVNDAACPGRCRFDCTCTPAPVCGNDLLEDGEECDGIAASACEVACDDGCVCTPPVCGNGIVAGDEQCDGTEDWACHTLCLEDCSCPPPVCGNGIPEDGEACEPGVTDWSCPLDACLPDCTCAECGNGMIEPPFEVCEPTDDAACQGLCSTQTCQCLSPTTDSCEAPHELETLPAVDRQTVIGATIGSADPAFACGYGGTPVPHEGTVWYALTAPATGRIVADTAGSLFDSVLAAYTGTCDVLTQVACDDDNLLGYQARLDFPVVGGTRYVLQAAPFADRPPGDLVIAVEFRPCGDDVADAGEECEPDLPETCSGACSPLCECLVPAADACADAVPATELPIHVRLGAFQSSGTAGDPILTCAPVTLQPAPSTWFRFVAPQDGVVRVATAGSDYDTIMGVLTGECGALTLYGCDDDSGGAYSSVVEQSVTGGVTYTVLVTPYALDPPDRLELTIEYVDPE
jgi:hypothetical protein